MTCSVTNKSRCVFLPEGSTCVAPKSCEPIIAECETSNLGKPCPKIILNGDAKYCAAYAFPSTKWNGKKCPLRQERRVEEEKKAINPLKASKKAAKGQ